MNLLDSQATRRSRWKPGALHFAASAVVGLGAAALVFVWWFPDGLAGLAGGQRLFWLITSVDVVLGPALTLVVANPTKPRRELTRDIAIIAVIQVAALVYGLSVLAAARPVAIVWEIDQFRLVSQAALDADSLRKAPAGLGELSWFGPVYRNSTRPRDAAEQLRTIELALAGVPLAALPRHWAAESAARAGIEQASQPLDAALRAEPGFAPEVASIARRAKVESQRLRGVPIHGRHGYWLAVVVPGGTRPVGFLAIDLDAVRVPSAPATRP